MKNTIVILASLTLLIFSCNQVPNAYPNTGSTLDWSLYPGGDSTTYANNGFWPTFTANTNTFRNVLIEDFTGHACPNCPPTGVAVYNSSLTNPTRIFEAAIHSGPTGLGSFQDVYQSEGLTEVFYNSTSLEIGAFFGSQPGTGFFGNPRITINRTKTGSDNTTTAGSLGTMVPNTLSSPLKVNIQANVNYFPSTRGVFLHTEVDLIDNSLSNLGLVVYVVEDSIVAAQKTNDLVTYPTGIISNYVHRDILRGTIDNAAFGRTLTNTYLNANGNYYVNYSYALPSSLEADNTHLLIYVYDKSTYEIYQVIKEPIN
jgi:Outer membrane protein Omp28